MKIKKFFICLMLSLIILTSCVFANEDTTMLSISSEEDSLDNALVFSPTASTVDTINEDLYIYNTDSKVISEKVNGNIFASTNKLTINPRTNGGIISGDIFFIGDEFDIESEVKYSDTKDKNDNYIVSNINSNSVINGNVYAFCKNFTLEAGSEINGDLYVYSTSVDIQQDAVIKGSLYVYAQNIKFNGQLSGSAYIVSTDFTMDYYAYVTNDLFLNCTNANLSGIVYRNAFITATGDLNTLQNFIAYKNLTINSASNFTFSGEVQGDVTVNANNFNLKNSDNDSAIQCSIIGNLKYGTEHATTIPDGVVKGEVSQIDFVNTTSSKFNLQAKFFGLLGFLVYVFIIILIAKFIATNCIDKLPNLTFSNIVAGFGIGLASIFAIFIVFVILCLTGIGVIAGFALLVAYLLLLAVALPLLVLNVANALKLNLNLYLKILIIAGVLYLISLIPILGLIVMFVAIQIGLGRILIQLFTRK